MLEISAEWNAFYLAQDEYKARTVVQKARELLGVLAEADARGRADAERRRQETAARQRGEKETVVRQQSALLLAQCDQIAVEGDPQQRGYLLEDLLNREFDLHGFTVARAFRRNNAGKQIDAAFEMEGCHYLVECRWRARLSAPYAGSFGEDGCHPERLATSHTAPR